MARIDFLGKGEVYSHHLSIPYRTLEVDAKKSVGKPSLDGNLIIHGDNLEALKALLPVYEGRIKCIYIDPPYNTGNEGWKYNDKVNSPLIKDWLDKTVDRDDQCRHDKWLSMMWPRLNLLHQLLADDGVIFISIDDNEQHRLRFIMDEIFGEDAFIGVMKRRASRKTAHLSKTMTDMCDYILAYSKDRAETLTYGKISDSTRPVLNEQNKETVRIIRKGTSAKCEDGKYETGIYKVKTTSFTLLDPLDVKDGKVTNECRVKAPFRINQEVLDKTIYITKNFGLRRYLLKNEKDKRKLLNDLIDDRNYYNERGTEQLGAIFEENCDFNNPKPFELVKFLISTTIQDNSEQFIILDSFAGSGTTAQAVLALNKEDGGNRKFILVECEDYADTITAERVRRVIKGVKQAKDETLKQGLGGAFTYCTLGAEIDEEKILTGDAMPSWEALAHHVFWLATGDTLMTTPKPNREWRVGKSNSHHVHLIYQPDKAFMESNESVLTGDMADALGKSWKSGEHIIVYAAGAYVSQKDLQKKHITFCQLPYAIRRKLNGSE